MPELLSEAGPRYLLELAGLEQRLTDPASGATFTVRVDQPLRIQRGAAVALLGPSGCGKTTLLTVLGLLRSPTRPETLERFIVRTHDPRHGWAEHDLKKAWQRGGGRNVEALRRKSLGFALQSGELLPALTVRENIASPLRLNAWPKGDTRRRIDELLDRFGLNRPIVAGKPNGKRLADQRVNRLSGGEYQRVALARAIAHRPSLVFVDEPTSALNRELAHEALSELTRLQCGGDSTGALVMITHDEELARTFASLVVRMAPRKGEPVGEVVEIRGNHPTAWDGSASVLDTQPTLANESQAAVAQAAANGMCVSLECPGREMDEVTPA